LLANAAINLDEKSIRHMLQYKEKCNVMSISPVKRLILETMWMLGKPSKATEIAKEAGLAFPSVMMHIIGLAKMGYVENPEKGVYTITRNGKKVLGVPEVDGQKAREILAYLPMEKSFHFYADIGKPLNMYATSLGDFCDKLLKVDVPSIEFHINRGDFEAWFSALGDTELARKTLLIREQKIAGEDLRNKFYGVVKKRYEELALTRGPQSAGDFSGNIKPA
jgi:predicted transcriptional regulator